MGLLSTRWMGVRTKFSVVHNDSEYSYGSILNIIPRSRYRALDLILAKKRIRSPDIHIFGVLLRR